MYLTILYNFIYISAIVLGNVLISCKIRTLMKYHLLAITEYRLPRQQIKIIIKKST